MKIWIKELFLYSYGDEIRSLSFFADRMNIITGQSKTGKSALIHIVNYCLGSSECHVPEGIIREKVSWYGIILEHSSKEQVFIARQNPEPGKATSSSIFISPGKSLTAPKKIDLKKNIDLSALGDFLTRFVGIEENLHVPDQFHTRPPLAANFSHARIYCFQEQSLIDNKNQLFFNQSDSFVAQAIRDTLPYFLGAVSKNELLKQSELSEVRREIKLIERQLEANVNFERAAENRAASLLAEARQVGLVSFDLRPTTLDVTMSALRRALSVRAGADSDNAGEGELNELLIQRENLRNTFIEIRDRLEEVKSFGSNKDQYELELAEQEARLRAITIIPEIHEDETLCPVCMSSVNSGKQKLEDLRTELAEVSGRISLLREQNPRLQHYISELTNQLTDITAKMQENQAQVNAVIQQNEILKAQRELAVNRSRVQGRISVFLETLSRDDVDDRETRLKLLQQRANELDAELTGENFDDRLRNVEYILAEYMTEYARELKLEHSDGQTRLDLRRLTVVADTKKHGSIRLDNMGAGDNWVGCHVLAHMALHRLFRERDRPVPAFLILDQPSKAHYPPDKELVDSSILDDDREAVRRLFHFIYSRTKESSFQTIVIDHADEAVKWFQDSIIERWRGGVKLVPETWPDRA